MAEAPPLNSKILAICTDGPATPSITIQLPQQAQDHRSTGWGLGWYPGGSQAAVTARDHLTAGDPVQISERVDWASFRSTMFVGAFLRGDKTQARADAQPFSRSFAGREWLFVHSGQLDLAELERMHGRKRRMMEPLGKTDSEFAFCHLLSRMQEERAARQLADIDPGVLLSWFQSLDALGTADLCLCDGLSVACFHGTRSQQQFGYTRIQPPDNQSVQRSAALALSLDDPRDTYRTMLLFSTARFSTGSWTPMQSGQMIIARRGAIVWDTHPSQQVQATVATVHRDAAQTPPQAPTTHPRVQPRLMNVRAVIATPDGVPLGYRMYRVTHATHYEYEHPVEHSTHRFRLLPTDDPVQEVVRSTLTLSSNAEQIQYEDVFGNQAVHCTINEPYTRLSVEAESIIKVYAAPPDDHSLSQRQSTIPLVWMPWQRQMMMPYVLPEELPESQLRELTDYAMGFVERNDQHLLRTLEDINLSIYRDFAYRPGTTALSTTSFEVYTARQGVCQDFANLFICLARLLSIPARYRMGYIYTGANYANKIQSDASHAWVEVYLPYVGWRGFDPTNGCAVAQDHIRVACGRTYADATPTAGTIYRGGGGEKLSIDVKVVATDSV